MLKNVELKRTYFEAPFEVHTYASGDRRGQEGCPIPSLYDYNLRNEGLD